MHRTWVAESTRAIWQITWSLSKRLAIKTVMVDTDGGQTENPHWELALAEYMQYLVDHGIPEEQVYHMTHTIPAKLLGIEE